MMRKIFISLKSLYWMTLAVEITVGFLISLSSLIVFMTLRKELLETGLNSIDQSVSTFLYSLRSPELNHLMLFITHLGGRFTIIIMLLFTLLLTFKKYTREGWLLTLSVVGGLLLDVVLKIIIQRPRPMLAPLIAESSYSFPSGHSMNSIIFYGTIVYLCYHFFKNKLFSLLILQSALLLVFLIGLSRIYLGVHYFSDVAAGFAAGLWWLLTVIVLEKTISLFEATARKKKINLNQR